MPAPKAVVWDFGNVVVRWDARTLYSKIFPDPAERDRFLAEVCTIDWHIETDRGVSFADNCAALAERHPEHHDAIWAWKDRWWEMFSGAIPETEAAIEALDARGVPAIRPLQRFARDPRRHPGHEPGVRAAEGRGRLGGPRA